MQKVEGSNPFSRSREGLLLQVFFVAQSVYVFATRQRSSRAIERHCRQDVAYRVITGQPDSRSRDDRALHLPARAGIGRAVRRGARAV
jgi:hypothetical protein